MTRGAKTTEVGLLGKILVSITQPFRGSSLFKPTDEIINLTIPILCLVVVLLGVSSPKEWFGMGRSFGFFFEEMLVDVLFLNVTHNAFTVMMLVSFPELREWLRRQKGGAKGFVLKSVLILVALSLLFGLGLAGHIPYFKEIVWPISLFFPIQHALAQSLGLSLIYQSRAAQLGDKPKKWLENAERTLVLFMILLIVSSAWAAKKFQVLNFDFQWLSFRTIFFCSMAVAVGLFIVGILQPKSVRLNKSLFALRYPVWALSNISPLALWATRAIHGIEYLFVMRKMASNSKFTKWQAIAIYIFLTVLVFAIFRTYFFSYARQTMDRETGTYDILLIIGSISVAFSYLHYYLDRSLFLMRNPDNRELVGGLLKP